MRNLILFLLKNKEHFVYLLTLVLSLSLLFNNDNDNMSVVRGLSSDIISLLSSPMVKIKSLTIVNEENQYLREKNLQLNLELESILHAADENDKLRELLDFKRNTNLKIIPSAIINKGIQANINSLTIDVGFSVGIKPNQAVLTPDGIISKLVFLLKSNNFLSFSFSSAAYNIDCNSRLS